jgi:hypothetical protein
MIYWKIKLKKKAKNDSIKRKKLEDIIKKNPSSFSSFSILGN